MIEYPHDGVTFHFGGVYSLPMGYYAGEQTAFYTAIDTFRSSCAVCIVSASLLFQDLFGGEGVLIKSATTATEPIKIQTKVGMTTTTRTNVFRFPRPLPTPAALLHTALTQNNCFRASLPAPCRSKHTKHSKWGFLVSLVWGVTASWLILQ